MNLYYLANNRSFLNKNLVRSPTTLSSRIWHVSKKVALGFREALFTLESGCIFSLWSLMHFSIHRTTFKTAFTKVICFKLPSIDRCSKQRRFRGPIIHSSIRMHVLWLLHLQQQSCVLVQVLEIQYPSSCTPLVESFPPCVRPIFLPNKFFCAVSAPWFHHDGPLFCYPFQKFCLLLTLYTDWEIFSVIVVR